MILVPCLLQIILKECHGTVKMLRAPLVTLLPHRRNQPISLCVLYTAVIRFSSRSLASSTISNAYILFHSCRRCETTNQTQVWWIPQRRTSSHGTGNSTGKSPVSFGLRLNWEIQTDRKRYRPVSSRQTLLGPQGHLGIGGFSDEAEASSKRDAEQRRLFGWKQTGALPQEQQDSCRVTPH